MKNALILGSGGARGFAHIGVLKVLEEINFPVHILSGTSIGALIAALSASGLSAQKIEDLIISMDWKSWFRLADIAIPKVGLFKGDRIEGFLKDVIGEVQFEDLNKSLTIMATDLESGKSVALNSGSVVEAIRASTSIPGAFQPKEIKGQYLVDGGLSDPVPVDIAQWMGAKKTIAIDVTTRVNMLPKKLPGSGFSLYDTLLRTIYIMESRVAELQISHFPPDILMRPSIEGIQILEFQKAKQAIEAGEKVARKHMEEILALNESVKIKD